MKRLIIADIHANLPAFKAVLEDAGHFDELIFLGDVLMYGPNPVECLELLQQLNANAIIGNHDLEVLDFKKSSNPNQSLGWATWTLDQLNIEHLNYLNKLPLSKNIKIVNSNVKIIHTITYEKYLLPSTKESELSYYLNDYSEDIIISGHTHRLIDRIINNQRFISLYSVGQPKDSSYQAGYTIELDGVLEHKRVDYDVEKYIYDIEKLDFFKPYMKRWINFIKTGYDSEWTGNQK